MEREMLELLKEIKTDLHEFKAEVNTQFKEVNTKLEEHTQILRALEHSAQVNKAEHDNMNNTIARM